MHNAAGEQWSSPAEAADGLERSADRHGAPGSSEPAPAGSRRWLAIVLPWWSVDRVRAVRANRAAGGDAAAWHGAAGRAGKVTANGSGSAGLTAPPGAVTRILVVREHHGTKQVVAPCPDSCTAGVRPGMKLAQARALCGVEAIEAPWDPAADRRALRRFAGWCRRYGPRVMMLPGVIDAPPAEAMARRGAEPAIVVDITGCELLHGSDASLLARVQRDLHRCGVRAQTAIASTQRAALAAAQAWPCRVLPPGAATAVTSLAPLPLWTLRLPLPLLESLREINVTRIGQALDLPRDGAVDRFGPELVRALDALRGECDEDFHPVPCPASIECDIRFDGATTRLESIELAVQRALDGFCAMLARRRRGVRLLEASLDRIDALPIVERLTLARPSRRPTHLWTLVRPRLERVNLGFGVEGVRLRSLIDAPLCDEQRSWSTGGDGRTTVEQGDDGSRVGEMLDQVRARLGHQAVHGTAARDADRAAAREAGRTAACEADRTAGRDGGVGRGAAVAFRVSAYGAVACRPTLVFPGELPAEVISAPVPMPVPCPAPGEPPSTRPVRPVEVRWAGGGGRVVESDGPERHAPRWWATEGDEIDCWRVRTDDGRWLWMAHRRPDRWSVIGLWA